MYECEFKCGCAGYESVAENTSDSLCYDGQVVLTSDITLPKVRTLGARIDYTKINAVFHNLSAQLRNRARLEMYPDAADRYIESTQNQIPFNPSQLAVGFETTLTAQNLFSVYTDILTYEGGANPQTLRRAYNLLTDTGEKLGLDGLFKPDCRWRELLLQQILRMAAQPPYSEFLFDNAEQLLREYFDKNNFYLSCDALYIFYQQVTVAPHSAGIPVFEIPLRKLRLCIRRCYLNCPENRDCGCACDDGEVICPFPMPPLYR